MIAIVYNAVNLSAIQKDCLTAHLNTVSRMIGEGDWVRTPKGHMILKFVIALEAIFQMGAICESVFVEWGRGNIDGLNPDDYECDPIRPFFVQPDDKHFPAYEALYKISTSEGKQDAQR